MGMQLTTMSGCMWVPRWLAPSWQAVRKQSAPPSALCAAIPRVFMGPTLASSGFPIVC